MTSSRSPAPVFSGKKSTTTATDPVDMALAITDPVDMVPITDPVDMALAITDQVDMVPTTDPVDMALITDPVDMALILTTIIPVDMAPVLTTDKFTLPILQSVCKTLQPFSDILA